MLSLHHNFFKTEKFYLLVIGLVACAVMLPVLFVGLPYGYDLPHHYQCAATFYESILSGDLYPSWSLNRNFGFGGMETRLYPPVSHYALALFYLLSGDWHIASWLALTFFAFVGGLGVYFWAREYMPAGQAVFAGCIYNLLPYHLNQIYNTFFYAEFVGSCVLPFAFVFISRVCRRGRAVDVAGLAVSFAVLILTHLPLTVIGAICFTIYGLSRLKREKLISRILKLAAGGFLGLAASSFFWIKVVQEKDLLAKTLNYPDPWLDYRFHFLLTPLQTFEGELLTRIYETATLWYDLMFLCAVVLALVCTIPFLLEKSRPYHFLRSVWILFGAAVFLAVPFSRVIWDNFPLLQEVQFPWRWLAIVSLAASVLSAGYLDRLSAWFRDRRRRPFALLICGAVFAVITFSLSQIVRQAPFIAKAAVAPMMEANFRDKGFTFWWTIWTKEEAFENKEKAGAGNRSIDITKWTATEREVQVFEGEPTNVRIATFYHPNWKAAVNDVPVEIKPDLQGAVGIPVSGDKSNVRLFFQETRAARGGRLISSFTWLFLITLCLFSNLSPRKINGKNQ